MGDIVLIPHKSKPLSIIYEVNKTINLLTV